MSDDPVHRVLGTSQNSSLSADTEEAVGLEGTHTVQYHGRCALVPASAGLSGSYPEFGISLEGFYLPSDPLTPGQQNPPEAEQPTAESVSFAIYSRP